MQLHHHHHTIYFENVHFFHAVLGLHICPYEVPPHILEYRPFRLPTRQFHVVIHTFSPSLPIPPLTSHPCHGATSTFLQTDTQSSTLICSRCPNHLNLPNLTTSTTLRIPRKLQILTSLPILQQHHTSIHLTIIRSYVQFMRLGNQVLIL